MLAEKCFSGSISSSFQNHSARSLERGTQHSPKELWHDVSLLKLLLHCFSPHVPYRRWQLTVLFVLFYIKKSGENEIKIHNKMHFYSESLEVSSGLVDRKLSYGNPEFVEREALKVFKHSYSSVILRWNINAPTRRYSVVMPSNKFVRKIKWTETTCSELIKVF